tara:strand:+ start:4321 stop:4692 length:372 start_codon:yes stop_codon:yes gene_type:complete
MKNKSIDDATPEEWNRLSKKSKRDLAWLDESDNAVNDHPVFGDNSTKFDSVHKPEHYNNGNMECIDAIRGMLTHDEYIGYLRGNALKYLWRFRYKNKPIEDLRKARWYEERLISYMLEHPSDK